MNVFETTGHVIDGKVIINLPDEYNNKKVKITVLQHIENDSEKDEFGDEENWANLPVEKKIEILKRFTGTAKYPNIDTNKYEVYDQ